MANFYGLIVLSLVVTLQAFTLGTQSVAEASKNTTNLNQMPLNTLLSIFDELNLVDQSTAITKNRQFQDLLSKHYLVGKIRLINHLSIWIGDDDTKSTDTIINDGYSSFDNQLTAMLETLPGIFTTIKIYNAASNLSQRSLDFLQKINEKCSASLEQLTLINLNSEVFSEWKIPFTNVAIVTIKNSSFPNGFDFNGIFPKIRRLVIESGPNSQTVDELRIFSVINQHFSHLTELFLHATDDHLQFNNGYIADMIRLNPQLRSLHMPIYDDRRNLQNLNEKLPNLRVFGLEGRWFNDNETIFLKNVKKFSWIFRDDHTNSHEIFMKIPRIEFDQHLETYDISLGSNKLDDIEISILSEKYKDLKCFVLKQDQIVYGQLLEIVRSMEKLTFLGIQWHHSIQETGVRPILIENDKLKKILIFSTVDGPSNGEILKIFPNKWKYEGDKVNGLNKFSSFVRKTAKITNKINGKNVQKRKETTNQVHNDQSKNEMNMEGNEKNEKNESKNGEEIGEKKINESNGESRIE